MSNLHCRFILNHSFNQAMSVSIPLARFVEVSDNSLHRGPQSQFEVLLGMPAVEEETSARLIEVFVQLCGELAVFPQSSSCPSVRFSNNISLVHICMADSLLEV